MFTLKDCITTIPIFRFVYDTMQTLSPIGRKELLHTQFISNAEALKNNFDDIENGVFWQKNNTNHLEHVKQLITSVNDIFATLQRLKNGNALDDVELFEIKKIALIMNELQQILSETKFPIFRLHEVNKVIDVLDPEKTKLPHFYIYSTYSKELTALRAMSMKADKSSMEDLFWQITKIENKIRQKLVKNLIPFAEQLVHNLHNIAKLDILLAKVALAIDWKCCKPEISNKNTSYSGLFHPVVVQRLKKENTEFQPIDIELKQEPCLITGANMTGKSIFLRSIAFSQWMFQFGFYVPAKKATIVPVEKIHFVSGDSDTENTGLSSFVTEIFHIHHILKEVKEPKKMLVLVDEFARTTNPKEGSALVTAFMEIMKNYKTMCLVTTHYSNVSGKFRRLRVKGIQWDKMEHIPTHPKELNKFIDYQLEDCNEKTAPEEAVKIAELLSIDEQFISLVKKYL